MVTNNLTAVIEQVFAQTQVVKAKTFCIGFEKLSAHGT